MCLHDDSNTIVLSSSWYTLMALPSTNVFIGKLIFMMGVDNNTS